MKRFFSFGGNTSLVFHQNHLIYSRQSVCRLFHFFSSAVVVLPPFGESPLMTLTSILKILELLCTGASDFQVISLQHSITAIIYLHSINIFSHLLQEHDGETLSLRKLTWCISPDVELFTKNNSSSCVILSFKISSVNGIFCIQHEPQRFLVYCEAKDDHTGKNHIIDID